MRFNRTCFLIALGLLAAEVLIATRLNHLSFIRNSLGDYLVVILLYCLIRSFFKLPPLALAAAIFLAACGLEIAQYFQLASVLGLRPGRLPAIILGSIFSPADILMYLLGCFTSFILDWRFSAPKSRLASKMH